MFCYKVLFAQKKKKLVSVPSKGFLHIEHAKVAP